jgi:hypothetical protein
MGHCAGLSSAIRAIACSQSEKICENSCAQGHGATLDSTLWAIVDGLVKAGQVYLVSMKAIKRRVKALVPNAVTFFNLSYLFNV